MRTGDAACLGRTIDHGGRPARSGVPLSCVPARRGKSPWSGL